MSPDSDVPIDVYAAAARRARDRGDRDHRPRRLRAGRSGVRLRRLRRPGADRSRRRRALGAAGRPDPVRRRAHLRPELGGRHPRPPPPPRLRLHHRIGPRPGGVAVQPAPRRRRGSTAGRSTRSSPRTSTRSSAAARSGLFDTIGHVDDVKRYLHPHVIAGRARRRTRSSTSRSSTPSSTAAPPSRSTRAGCATRSPRRTRRRRSSPASASSAARAVTVGSDAHRAGAASALGPRGSAIAIARRGRLRRCSTFRRGRGRAVSRSRCRASGRPDAGSQVADPWHDALR